MTSKKLTRIINTHLFVPIEETLVERLHEVTMLLTANVDTDMIEDYTRAFIKNEVNCSFRRLFKERYQELYSQGLQLPNVVYLVLEIYFVRQCLKSDNIDSNLKLQFSYIVKNYAILRKGSWDGVLCLDWIIWMYQYSDTYACKPANSFVPFSNIMNTILPCNEWTETGLEITSQEVYNQLRSLCVAGIKGRFNSFVESPTFRSLNNPFVQIYVLVNKMVNDWNWKYISSNPAERIRSVMGDNAKKRRKLSNITDTIRTEVIKNGIIKPVMKSSVLLKKVYDNELCGIEECVFSVLEFGIYLYYEFLLESYND